MPDHEPSAMSFVTGYPTPVAVHLARCLLADEPEAQVVMLVRERHLQRWDEQFRAALPADQAARVEAYQGDVVDMDLGLSGVEYSSVLARAERVYHAAGVYWLGAGRDDAYRVNVEGTAEVLRLCQECERLRRFVYFSTALVSGSRTGVVQEDDLDAGQSFRNAFEETRYVAERLVRRHMDRVPTTVLRPSVVVGHSETGEMDRLSGPYFLLHAMATWPAEVPLPLPGRGDSPMNLVPVDFVSRAAAYIARDPRGEGRTFHLTDPNPLSARRVFELVARAAGRRPPRGHVPKRMARTILRLPGLSGRSAAQLHFLECFDQLVIWRCVNTLLVLQGSQIRCPPFETYVDKMVDHVRRQAGRG